MKSVDDLLADGVKGKRVLVRSDLNVPLDGTRITDDGRIRAALGTIGALAEAGARVVVVSHLGRPKNGPEATFSLAPVAVRLGELLGQPVQLAADVAGPASTTLVEGLEPGQVCLLENVRFDAAETSKDAGERADLAQRLADLCDAYVDDAFGAIHRAHASVVGVPALRPHYAGRLVATELDVLHRLTDTVARPYVVVLGGSKISDKLAVVEALLPTVDALLVGGGMCFTFLAAQGYDTGSSLLEKDMVETCRALLAKAAGKIVLPVDVVAATAFAADAEHSVVPATEIPAGRMGLDVGPATVALFASHVEKAKTVFWNGPMGVFELAPYAAGTKGVAEAVVAATGHGAFTVVGGGDSAAAVRVLGLPEDGFTHISTGGGASLEFLEGKQLPGVVALS